MQSCGRMFCPYNYDLRPEIEFFLEKAEKPDPRLCDHDWMIIVVFCMDIVTEQMDQLIINLTRNESPYQCDVWRRWICDVMRTLFGS